MSRNSPTPPSFTNLFGRIFTAQWAYVGPWQATFLVAVGFHIAVSVRLGLVWSWLPVVSLIIGFGMLAILMKIPWFGPSWGGRQSFSSVLDRVPGVWKEVRAEMKRAIMAGLLLCAFPAPVGVIFSAVMIVFGGYFFSRPTGFYRTMDTPVDDDGSRSRPEFILGATTVFFGIQALGLLIAGFSFNWNWQACAWTTLLISGAYVLVVVGGVSERRSRVVGRSSRQHSGVGFTPVHVLALVAPVIVSFWSEDKVAFLIACAILWLGIPIGMFYWAYLKRTGAERACHNALLKGTPDMLLEQAVDQKGRDEKGRDDDVLGSDGYYRIVRPGYIPLQGRDRSPGGFAGWVKSNAFGGIANSDVLGGEWVAFRGISGIDSPVAKTHDKIGQLVHELMGDLIPVSQHKSLSAFAGAFDRQCRLSIVQDKVDQRLLKCPWDSPEVLLLPLKWKSTLNFPPGCGLFDSEGKPCYANQVQLSVAIRQELRDAINAVESGRATEIEVERTRRLFSLFQRILPSCYEALLLGAIITLRDHKVPVLGPSGPDGDPDLANRKEWYGNVRKKVEEHLHATLPKEIAELVECSVGEVPIDSYLLPKDKRTQASEMEADERNKWIELQTRRREALDELELQLLGRRGANRIAGGEWQLAKPIEAELNKVRFQLENAGSRLLDHFKEASINESNFLDLPRLQAEVRKQTTECLVLLEERRKLIHEAFSNFNDAFRTNSEK